MNFKLSFKMTILCLFTALTLILGTAIISLNFAKNRETVLVAADNLLNVVANGTFARAQLLFEPHFVTVETFVLVTTIETKPGALLNPITELLYDTFKRHPEILSAYVGFETGEFIQIFSLAAANPLTRKSLGAPMQADFALRNLRQDGERAIQGWRFIDAERNTVLERTGEISTYDPRVRPWYKAATSTDTAIATDFYTFSTTPSVGITVAKRFKGDRPGVFAIDLTLSSMSSYLNTERLNALNPRGQGQIALVSRGGGLVAHSDKQAFDDFLARQSTAVMPPMSAVGDPVIETVVRRHRDSGETAMRVSESGRDWIARAIPLPPPFPNGTTMAVAVPMAEFIDPLLATTRDAVVLSALVLLVVFLPLVYLAVSAVSNPLARVTREIEQLRHLEIATAAPVTTFIREIQNLADALARSRFMLRVFEKYVPRNLVQQLADTGTEPTLGGERREVSVLFTDVRDFTTMSEELPPEELMRVTSVYLEGLVDVILKDRGTVDKFVGDQIMAYWNAPLPNPDHAADGCKAILRCQKSSNAQNAAWEAAGRPIFYTRFALHLGDAVVGNVGSSDRMDYTVIGNTINLGSRLEGLNKVYGTQVLVSDPVKAAVAGRFVSRPIDKVLPKGAVFPLGLHELVGAHPDWADAPADLVVDRATVNRCARWAEVYAVYLARDWSKVLSELDRFAAEFGEDSVTALYFDRVARFIMEPPEPDWDGVIRYSEK